MDENEILLSTRELPHSIEAEQSVLGAIISQPSVLSDVIELIKPEYFYNEQHKALYSIMLQMNSMSLPVDIVTVLNEAEKQHIDKVMVYGGSEIGELLAKALHGKMSVVKIIDKDKDRCIEMSENLPESILVSNGDGRNPDFLIDESIKDYDAFVAVTESDETNILSCVIARKLGISRTVAEVENIEYIHLAEEMGVDTVINKKLITAGRIFKFTLSGKARFVKYMGGTDAEILEYTVTPGSPITRKPLKELNFPANAIIGGVIRGSESMIAVGDTHIEAYDRVAVFALPESVAEVDKFFRA